MLYMLLLSHSFYKPCVGLCSTGLEHPIVSLKTGTTGSHVLKKDYETL